MSTHTEDTTTGSTVAATASEQYTVPTGDDAFVCEYCGAPFATEEYHSLHLGLQHGASLTDDQRDAFEAAATDEAEELKLFRLKALGLLVLLYFGLLMTYAVVT
ncbi:C2H2-type zinc finger protein [Halorientalis brevis]|uniref:C2H2-type zinc finger protein n=1 Tax=Halorientalis brevis TaxID=1126241 RepID=A0ABD6CG68_9EURY|nr:C2H2-type zinc finger protein [Halorientalis brevis]